MDWNGLIDSVNRLSSQMEFIQEYISLKFGLDFQQFCENKNYNLEKVPNFKTPTANSTPSSQKPTPAPARPKRSTRSTPKVVEVVDEEEGGLLEGEVVEYYNPPAIKMEGGDDDSDEIVEDGGESLMGTVISVSGGGKMAETLSSDSEDDETEKEKKRKEERRKKLKRWLEISAENPDRHAHLGISYRKNDKGLERLLTGGFIYKCYKTRESGRRYWKCDIERCTARLVQERDGKLLQTKGHDHSVPGPAAVKALGKPKKKRKSRGDGADFLDSFQLPEDEGNSSNSKDD